MRNDLLNMIVISRNASLDEVITEVQQTEDILYRRAKGERLTKQIKQPSSSNAETSPNKRYNED
jgi:ABC-type hemin transport system substrate-binding protein